MAHEITKRKNGESEAFYANKPAWHGLGVTVAEAPNSAEAIKLAKLDWTVSKKSMFDADMKQIPGYVALTRDDNKEILSVAKSSYGIVQNEKAFEILDQLSMDGSLKYESAFSIRGGKIVNLLARMPGAEEVADGDKLIKYMLLQTSFDGSTPLRILPTYVRVVCANTWKQALRNGKENIFSVKHTKNAVINLEKGIEIFRKINEGFDIELEQVKILAERKLKANEFDTYLKTLFPDADTKGKQKNIEKTKKAVSKLYYEGELNTFGTIKETAWSAFNAITEFVDHTNPANMKKGVSETRKKEILFERKLGKGGGGNKIKQAAWVQTKNQFLAV